MKYFIQTFGCQMNEADSERLAGVMEKRGYQLAKQATDAEAVLINTCSVREAAENRVFGLVRNLTLQKRSGQKIILTGCMVGSTQGKRQRYTLRQLRQRLPQVDEFKTIKELLGSGQFTKHQDKKRALVPIMQGCNHFCSYCVVPYARGEETSRPFEEIVCEVGELVQRGCEKVMLLGQNVNSYTGGQGFAALLQRLHKIKGLKKISLMTSNPWDLTDEIIDALSLPKVDRQFHLPVQSGDDEILLKMNRPYTAAGYLALVKKIKKKIPDVQISTDIIVGFPGETSKQFANTVKLCQQVGFNQAFIARYSSRPGTAAFKFKDNVASVEKKQRWQILEKLVNQDQ